MWVRQFGRGSELCSENVWWVVYIDDIVMYNIRFRDCLREKGGDGVIKMLIDEAPAIAKDSKAIEYLKQNWTERMKEHIADYDIQCLPKDSLILIDDYLFNGLDEIDAHSEVSNCQSVI